MVSAKPVGRMKVVPVVVVCRDVMAGGQVVL